MSDYEYTGPRVARTASTVARVRLRCEREVQAIANSRYNEAMKAWANADEGRFPDKDQITREVAAELETLLRALDGWGAVEPDTIFKPGYTDFGFLH